MRAKLMTPLTLALLGVLTGCASEDRLKAVENQVTDLKVEVFKLRSQMEESNKKAEEDRNDASVARTQDRRFQADLQETMRQLQDSTRILNNRLGDVATQQRRPAPASRPTAPAAPAQAEAQAPGAEEEKAFNAAVLDYNRGNYALAADGLALFLKAHPDSPKVPDGLFYLGLAYYNQKAYDKAQPAFDRILKEYASSNQFLPAKLKRAQCLLKLGLKAAAIKTFKEITESFQGTPEARTAKQELEDLGF